MTTRVAVLMACHDRVAVTVRCLDSLAHQELTEDISVDVYLVDDGSSDGTSAEVRRSFPKVTVIRGSGDLFWTGGTLLAEHFALQGRPNYLLWLNDDVTLKPLAIALLLSVAKTACDDGIISGAVADSVFGRVCYGGQERPNRKRPLRFALVQPNGETVRVETMNGNVVLIPVKIRAQVGPLDRLLTHNMADLDYGLRATNAGFEVLLAPTIVGVCTPNESKSGWRDPTRSLRERVAIVTSPKGLPPSQWLIFTRRHAGWRWPAYFVSPYVRALVAGAIDSVQRRYRNG